LETSIHKEKKMSATGFFHRKILPALTGLLAGVGLLALPVYAEQAGTLIRVGGTGSGSVLLQSLAEEYKKAAPAVVIEVIMPVLGSSGGMRALATQRIDVAVLGRRPKPDEERDGLQVSPWAETPLVLATNTGKKAGGLDNATLAALLRGTRGVWDDGARIALVLRQPAESDNATLGTLSPDIKAALDIALRNPTSTIADTDLDAVDLLTRTPGSLGTTTLGMLKIKHSNLKPLVLNGVTPSLQTLHSGAYPLGKKLFLAHNRNPGGPVGDFVTWLKSPAAAAKLRELDHLSLPR
jgi:phosphate transport system substrate-binding protein